MTTDESGQLNELTPATESESSVSISPDGTSSAPPDIDERPIGACHLEMLEVKAAVSAVRAANARAQAALAKFWACRDAAAGRAGALSALLQRDSTESTCEMIESHIHFIERMIETP